jgi:hypothetical protein
MPPGGNFTFRLAELCLFRPSGGGHALSSLALWEVVARGGFPVLEHLRLPGEKWTWGAESGPAVVAAFEGVAATLKTLELSKVDFSGAGDGGLGGGVSVQLGEAVGKLRRLETLELNFKEQGLRYYQVAQGTAKGACPALRSLTCSTVSGAALLACRPSTTLPSVQKLTVSLYGSKAESADPLALATGLKGLGYRGSLTVRGVPREGPQRDQTQELLRALAKVSIYWCSGEVGRGGTWVVVA